MDVGLLEKSNHMKPLLVKLYDTHCLYKRSGEDNPSAQNLLTQTVSELLESSVSDREKELVADILLALLRQAETTLREALAQKISKMDSVPSRLILSLAYDEIEIAKSVLKHSPVLETLDLMYILQTKDPSYWQVIATRQNLPEIVADELSSLDDEKTHTLLAGNKFIKLSDIALNNLFEVAQHSDEVAQPFLERSDVPQALVKKLYQCVGDSLKLLIEERYDFFDDLDKSPNYKKSTLKTVNETIDQIVLELENPDYTEVSHPYLPSKDRILSEQTKFEVQVGPKNQIKQLMLDTMQSELKLKNYKSFVAKFSVFMGLSGQDAIDVLSQQYGHGLAVLCRAHQIDRDYFIKTFLLTDPIRSGERVVECITLSKALSYYDRLDTELSRRIYKNNCPSAKALLVEDSY